MPLMPRAMTASVTPGTLGGEPDSTQGYALKQARNDVKLYQVRSGDHSTTSSGIRAHVVESSYDHDASSLTLKLASASAPPAKRNTRTPLLALLPVLPRTSSVANWGCSTTDGLR